MKKRSVILRGKKTSISVEDAFWNALKEIARERGKFVGDLVGEIDSDRASSNLSSSIRIFILEYYRAAANGAPALPA